ncbi:hypothetical protein DIE00_34090 [Burkholderia sp. Bp8989]|nr:hypothetical protein DIE05_29995 [Burkholderia sp. Bp8995]RQS39236.1 hypothetical protein DIE00_34090 [Burkholderia sp. Bp8989]
MPRRWTPEQRAAQAEKIRRWKPWERSTGPVSDDGKAASSQNALKHGMRGAAWLEKRRRLAAMIRDARAMLALLKGD